MNNIPTMMITTGFKTDQNGVLTEIVVPAVVSTLNVPRKITFEGQTLNYIPSTTAALQEISCPNISGFANMTFFQGYTALTKASFNGLVSLPDMPAAPNSGIFRSCTALKEINMTSLVTMGTLGNSSAYQGHFSLCTSLTTVNMPLLQSIGAINNNNGIGQFYGCTSLVTLALPRIASIGGSPSANSGHFNGCTALTTVQLGSEGNPVTSIGNYTFGNCTQSGLTITIYTSGGAALSGSPWGATNATIVYEEA